MSLLLKFIIVYSILNICVTGTADNPDLDMEYLYKQGIDNYLDNRWDMCVKNLEFAIQDWHWWNLENTKCRLKCDKKAKNSELLWPEVSNTDIVFEQMIYNTLCLVQCKKAVFGNDRMDIIPSFDLLKDFESMKPYDYLQLCYFQMNRHEDAANAAFTVLSAQPDHEIMKNNLEYYLKVGNVDPDDVVDLELKEYAVKYYTGDGYYQNGDYKEAVEYMEDTLKLYWDEYRDCRALCETPFDQGWFPDFVSSISNHFTVVLRCKSKCHKKLSTLRGSVALDFIPSIFNYLQYSYHKIGMLQKATEAVSTYLLLDPDNAKQLRNKQFYFSLDGITDEYFTPRKEVVQYKKRIEYEEKLLDFIDTKFVSVKKEKVKESKELNEDQPSIMESLSSVLSEFLQNSNTAFDDNKSYTNEEL